MIFRTLRPSTILKPLYSTPANACCNAYSSIPANHVLIVAIFGNTFWAISSAVTNFGSGLSAAAFMHVAANALQLYFTLQNWHHSPGFCFPLAPKASTAAGFSVVSAQLFRSSAVISNSERLSIRGCTIVRRTRLILYSKLNAS